MSLKLPQVATNVLQKFDKSRHFKSTNLTRIGLLYMIAALFQCCWVYLIVTNAEVAKQFLLNPLVGWCFAICWIGMLWIIPHLFYIGVRLIALSRDPAVIIQQTSYEKQKMRTTVLLLILGILLDILLVPYMWSVSDKGIVILLSGIIGIRILQANMEAVFQYHRM